MSELTREQFERDVNIVFENSNSVTKARFLAYSANLHQRIEEMEKELDILRNTPPKQIHEPLLQCGHNSYWKTIYDNCMACRAEKAEGLLDLVTQERDALKAELESKA